MATSDPTPGLSEAEQAIVDAIIGHPLAWCPAAVLEEAGGSDAVEALASRELIERWDLEEGPAWTLTPLGAWRTAAVIVEKWHVEQVVKVEEQGPGRKPRRTRETVATESPVWRRSTRDEHDDPVIIDDALPPPPIYSKTGAIPVYDRLELCADYAPGPVEIAIAHEQYLMEEAKKPDGTLDADPATGKVRRRKVLLFAGAGGGVPVKLDPRLSKGKNQSRKSPRTQAKTRKTG